MGGDGGVIANQRRFTRHGSKQETKEEVNKKEQSVRKSKYCSCSSQPLAQPIVACKLGNLFNKEIILLALLDKTLHDKFSHIRGLKDLKDLKLTPNPTHDSTEESSSAFACPVTQVEFNGILPFFLVWSTGYVLSEKAVKEIGIPGLQAEYGPFTEQDLVRLLPSEEELPECITMMEARRSKSKSDRKRKHLPPSSSPSDPTSSSESTSSAPPSSDTAISTSTSTATSEPSSLPRKSSKTVPTTSTSSSSSSLIRKSSSSSSSSLQSSVKLTKEAVGRVEGLAQQSAVYNNLFHQHSREGDGGSGGGTVKVGVQLKEKKDKDLFMTVGGLRYTLS